MAILQGMYRYMLRWIRRLLVRAAAPSAVAVACVLSSGAAVASAATQFWITGHGWGHGIGMSQYGAQGFATRAGWTASQIVTYYYQGSSVADAPAGSRRIRVLLASGRSTVRMQADGAGANVIGASSYPAQPGDVVIATVNDGAVKVVIRRNGSAVFSTSAAAVRVTGSARGLFTADNGAYGHHYRGELQLSVHGTSISVVNSVGLDAYVKGVVPSEMPPGWHPEALKAQALAARSYALATGARSYFDQHSDTRSQVYRGIEEEEASTSAAVDATAGKVITYGGDVVPAFFFSTSGGRTAAIEDVWGSDPRPYLRSVPDPYERSPYSSWPERLSFTPTQLSARLLGDPRGRVGSVVVSTNRSRRAASVVLGSSRGITTLTPATFQSRLGLRSTWFRVFTLSIGSRGGSVAPGKRAVLEGVAPAGTDLWRRSGSDPWVKVGRVTTSTGPWRRAVRVEQDTSFRLRRGSRIGPGVRVRVVV